MATIYTLIMNGDIPGTFVHRDETCVAILDINPINTGHVLVIPVQEVDHWLDLDPDVTAHLMAVARRIGLAQQAAFNPARVGMMIAGFEVPHTHIHVIPMDSMDHISFASARPGDADEREAAAEKIRAALAEL